MQAVVIAAGESKRFWPLNNDIHKSQFKLLGKSLLYWTLRGVAENGITSVCVVVGKNSSIPHMLGQENDLGVQITYAVQEDPRGTGNALWQAKDFVKESFVLLYGTKVNSKELVRQMADLQNKEGSEAVLVGTEVDNPAEYGVFRFEGGKPVEIIENPEEGVEPSHVAFVGARLLHADFLEYYEKLPKHHEADLVEATNAYLKDKNVSFLQVQDKGLSVKYPWDLFSVMDYLLREKGQIIHPTATIGKNVVLDGPVYIGENCQIGHGNILRGPLNLEAGVKTGSLMELKHCIVQESTTFHSGYAGDSIIGKNCRFGAGYITGNVRLDKEPMHGLAKLGVIVGDNTAFGIHTGTMPGVLVGKNCKVGPGTQVFEDIEDNITFYAKFDHVKKTN